MEKRIIVRKAVIDDYFALTELALQLGHEEDAGKVRDRLGDLLKRADHVIFVAEVDRQIAGWIHGFLFSMLYLETVCEIAALVVDKNHRKQGIGKKLIDFIKEWAQEQGCSEVSLHSNIKREEAHRFYQHIGFELMKTSHTFSRKIEKMKQR